MPASSASDSNERLPHPGRVAAKLATPSRLNPQSPPNPPKPPIETRTLKIKEKRCFQSTVVGLVLHARQRTKKRRKTAKDARAGERVSDCATKGIFLFACCE